MLGLMNDIECVDTVNNCMVMRRRARGDFLFVCFVLIHSSKICIFAAHGDVILVSLCSQTSMNLNTCGFSFWWTHVASAKFDKIRFTLR